MPLEVYKENLKTQYQNNTDWKKINRSRLRSQNYCVFLKVFSNKFYCHSNWHKN